MIVAACFFVAGVGCSLALIIRELRKAPEGYEDEHGFYTARQGEVKYGVPRLDEGSQNTQQPELGHAARARTHQSFSSEEVTFFRQESSSRCERILGNVAAQRIGNLIHTASVFARSHS